MNQDLGVLDDPIPFGKYCLLEQISVGGMAEVFKAKAFGAEGFERLLAVKRILKSIAEDETFISMFIDEAKIAGQLNHPNIAQIFDLGKVNDSYFIAMEYISGKDLRTIWDRMVTQNLKPDIYMAVHIVMKACAALHYAHTKRDAAGNELNIVHRDVSPHNILISYEGDAKIIDFGIAKAKGKSTETQVGILKGKFSYMSPEQVRGLDINHRADIFSLGIVLYETLTLERLFLGESDFDTLEKIRKVELAPPTLYNPHIPHELETIVLKALAKSPDDRFQTSSELYDALDQFMRNQGSYYQTKELAQFMKSLFAEEIQEEQRKLEKYRAINIDTFNSQIQQHSQQTAVTPLGWGDEELDTRIYGRMSTGAYDTLPPPPNVFGSDPADDPLLATPVADIVYKSHTGAHAAATPILAPDILDVAEIAAGFDELEDPTMEFDRNIHLKDLETPEEPAPIPPPPEPASSLPKPLPPVNDGPDLFGPSPTLPTPAPTPAPPKEKSSNGVVIALLAVIVLLLLGGIGYFVLGQKDGGQPTANNTEASQAGDATVTFKISNAESNNVTVTIDNKIVYEGSAAKDVVIDKVASGTRSISVAAAGFKTLNDTLKVEQGQKYVLPIPLEKGADTSDASKPSLTVSVTPKDAEVLLDGKKVTDPLPFTKPLDPKAYTLLIRKSGFLDETRQITLKEGAPQTVNVTLRPALVSLSVTPKPAKNAVITLYRTEKAGQPGGTRVKSSRGSLKADNLDATKFYRVEVQSKGHKTFTEEFAPGVDPSKTITANLVTDGATTEDPKEKDPVALRREKERREKERRDKERRDKERRDKELAAKTTKDPKKNPTGVNIPDPKKDPKKDPPPEKKGHGKLNIASKPAAQVYIDGRSVGWTPVIGYKVTAGPHKVVLIDKNGKRITKSVNVPAGGTKAVMNVTK